MNSNLYVCTGSGLSLQPSRDRLSLLVYSLFTSVLRQLSRFKDSWEYNMMFIFAHPYLECVVLQIPSFMWICVDVYQTPDFVLAFFPCILLQVLGSQTQTLHSSLFLFRKTNILLREVILSSLFNFRIVTLMSAWLWANSFSPSSQHFNFFKIISIFSFVIRRIKSCL